jgi:hypothetical protein
MFKRFLSKCFKLIFNRYDANQWEVNSLQKRGILKPHSQWQRGLRMASENMGLLHDMVLHQGLHYFCFLHHWSLRTLRDFICFSRRWQSMRGSNMLHPLHHRRFGMVCPRTYSSRPHRSSDRNHICNLRSNEVKVNANKLVFLFIVKILHSR